MEQEKKGVWDVISDLLLELDSATAAMDLIADGMEYNDDDGNADNFLIFLNFYNLF